MFGCYWKLGQTKNVFSVDCKIRATGLHCYFHFKPFLETHKERKRERKKDSQMHKQREREREREREIAPSNPQSCLSNRHPRPLHTTVSALFIQAPLRSHTSTQHRRDRSTSKSSDPSSMSSDPHDPPMPDLSLSRSTSPFPSLVDHSLFLLLSVWPSFWC